MSVPDAPSSRTRRSSMLGAGLLLNGVVPALLGAVFLAVILAQVLFYFCRTVDDCFITLRYADHFASGRGLVYNVGERVEGFSSPLWVLLASLGAWLGVDGTLWLKILGLAGLALLVGVAAMYLTRRHGVSPHMTGLALVALGSNSYVLSWALLGLETPLYLALLLALPLTLQATLEQPSSRHQALSALTLVALAATRPEAPLFAFAIVLGVVFVHPSGSLRKRAVRAGPTTFGAALCLGLLLVARRGYFGLWLPHTYYAKQGNGLDPSRLAALVDQGATPLELGLLLGGLGAALWLALRRRDAVPLVVIGTNLAFASLVIEDWMPNQRHFLPIWVLCTLAAAIGLDALVRRTENGSPWLLPPVAAGLAGLVACGAYQFHVDSRFSSFDFRSHGQGRHWIREKSPRRWEDAWLALTRHVPPHVQAMSLERMGMIQQLFWVLEASSAPLQQSVYVGRDIGRVGYFAPVRVFDTDGLFTPDVVRNPQWAKDRGVSLELGRRVFALRPVVAQLLDGFALLPRLLPEELGNYVRRPGRLERVGPRASSSQVLRRYEWAARRFPQGFYMATLYGECVGAAFEKRYAAVRGMYGDTD